MKKVFRTASPVQIAKFICRYINGEFSVQGIGTFRFKNKKIEEECVLTQEHRSLIRQINQAIIQMNHKLAQAFKKPRTVESV